MKNLIAISIFGFLFSFFISWSSPKIEKEYVNEEYIEVEDWMLKPFKSDVLYEEPLEVEEWMLKPFELN